MLGLDDALSPGSRLFLLFIDSSNVADGFFPFAPDPECPADTILPTSLPSRSSAFHLQSFPLVSGGLTIPGASGPIFGDLT